MQCMLGRRGDFEGVADWLSMLPLWSLCMCLSVCLSVCLFLAVYISVTVYVYVSVYVSVCYR